MQPQSGVSFKYSAFLSYSHQDERWAKWLQKALETYRVPSRLVGAPTAAGLIPRRLAPVFRDSSDLSTASDLGAEINEALRESANLIVICSPSASTSRWVNEEISAFRHLGRGDRIFCLIVAGEPNASDLPGRAAEECFAPALRLVMGAAGRPSDRRLEPIAADARPGRDGKTSVKLKIISGLLGVGLDVLKHREHRRRVQRMAVVAALAVVVMLITTGLAIDALIARKEAELRQREAEALVDFMLGDLNVKLRQVQRLDILEAVDNRAMAYFASRPTRNVTDDGLALRTKALQEIGSVRADQGNLPAAVASYRAASELAAELVRRAPGEPERQAAYAKTLNLIGNAYWFQGDLDHAYESFQRAIVSLEQATATRPSIAALAVLASARTNAGRVREARGDFAAAKALYEAVQIGFADLVSREPGNAHWQSELGFAYDNLGKVALEQGQLTEAIRAYRDVRRVAAALSAHSPGDHAMQENLLLSDAILGRTLALCGADDDAVRYVGEAVGIAKTLVAIDATQADWRGEFAEYSRLLGGLARGAGRLDAAAGLDAEAARVLGELVATDKTNTMSRRELANTQIESARLQLARGELAAADRLLDTALTSISSERVANPKDRNVQLLETEGHIVGGQVAARRRDMPAARAHWTQARDAIATTARVGADPNFLAAWASALLLLDDTASARPVVEKLESIGYRTADFDALLVAKQQPYRLQPAVLRCGGVESGTTVGVEVK